MGFGQSLGKVFGRNNSELHVFAQSLPQHNTQNYMESAIFRPVHSPITGVIISIEVYAGRINGRKQRRRFKVSDFGNLKLARSAAEAWVHEIRGEKTANQEIFFALDARQREQAIQAIKLLELHNINVLDAVRLYALPALAKRPLNPWTFRQAANEFLEYKRMTKKS